MIKLERVKQHLRIDHDDEDEYLAGRIDAAKIFVERDINRNLYADAHSIPQDDTYGIVITADLEQAMLLLIGNWYEHREAAADATKSEVPLAYWRLVQHYRLYGV
ncbi:head-tail connector protein [Suttonella ornithocola]|uniref:Phage gp6-like head-tail connector protein n=1 Tax=Suttonella ornithocola TaxID=279832 RepID=A0A380MV45_9GAMM|nr:head-tail connector protein [Suttonella ornithocola]SUO95257.1 Phage gp6-like head-tail connector protein [Suttonella ornithocola]